MHLENSHGWYGVPSETFGISTSLLPMNIKPEVWGELVGPNADFYDPGTI